MITATAALWWGVALSGIYHGLNPAMGWPLAVSAALMGGGRRALAGALALLALGHFLAMTAILLPFSLLTQVAVWQRPIRIAAGVAVAAFGLWLLVRRRHPRVLARIRSSQLVLWSFAVATAHGAGLMLVPIYLGLCRGQAMDRSHQALGALLGQSLGSAVAVAVVHTTAMIAAGGLAALLVYGWLGLQVLSRAWLNLETAWAASLILVGGLAAAQAGVEAG